MQESNYKTYEKVQRFADTSFPKYTPILASLFSILIVCYGYFDKLVGMPKMKRAGSLIGNIVIFRHK